MVINADEHKAHCVKLQQLAALHPWPELEQASAGDYADTHLSDTDRSTLAGIIPREAVLLLVVGAANSTLIRYLCDLSLVSTVIVLVTPEDLPVYDEFVAQMRYYRRQVVPIYMTAVAGMRYVHAAGVVPGIVYHNITDTTFEAMYDRLSVGVPLFSSSVHAGHAWSTAGLRKAVGVVAERRGREYDVYSDSIWVIQEHGRRRQQQRTRRRRQ